MKSDWDAITSEYDDLLLKNEKSEEDMRRIEQIEAQVWGAVGILSPERKLVATVTVQLAIAFMCIPTVIVCLINQMVPK